MASTVLPTAHDFARDAASPSTPASPPEFKGKVHADAVMSLDTRQLVVLLDWPCSVPPASVTVSVVTALRPESNDFVATHHTKAIGGDRGNVEDNGILYVDMGDDWPAVGDMLVSVCDSGGPVSLASFTLMETPAEGDSMSFFCGTGTLPDGVHVRRFASFPRHWKFTI